MTRGLCAICFLDPETGLRGTNATTRICQTCRRECISGVAVNEEWLEDDWRHERLGDQEDIAALEPTAAANVEQLQARPIRDENELAVAIVDWYARGAWLVLSRRDLRGRAKGRRLTCIPLTEMDIAFLLNVDQRHVSRVLRRFLVERASAECL